MRNIIMFRPRTYTPPEARACEKQWNDHWSGEQIREDLARRKMLKDHIGVLIAHGARIRRSHKSQVNITLDVFGLDGDRAVEIGFDGEVDVS